MEDNPELVEQERARYVEWVDSVVHRQSGGDHALRRFTLRFDLNISYKSCIDRWIRFALAKQVKVLVLDFVPADLEDFRPDCEPNRLPYLLGHEVLIDADVGCSQWSSGLGYFGLSPSLSWHGGCRYLEHLSLTRVNVEGELIEQLLATCPVLEKLVLGNVSTMNKFRVSGQSLKLKYLEIKFCNDLQSIEIYETNLLSFTYGGSENIGLSMDKVPQLSEVSIEECALEGMHVIMSELSSLSCLHILKLHLFISWTQLWDRQLPELTSVKQLELRFDGHGDGSLLQLTPVIEACPCLQSFVFKLKDPMDMLCRPRELKRVVGCTYRHLKVVEFHNYYGRPSDLELVSYLIENAIALEKLVVNPCEEYYLSKGTKMKKVKKPRIRAVQQLKGNFSSGIELVIN